MPLSKIQRDVLGLLASERDPESYLAGSIPLSRNTNRYSKDIDIFHDREERVGAAAKNDSELLEAHGYALRWQRRESTIESVSVSKDGLETKLEWVADSDYRFFPIVRDELFGYVLHPVDLATNKAHAAVGRREVRDIVDLVTIDELVLPLGAVIWAAVDKMPGFTPEGMIAEIRRNSRYSKPEWDELQSDSPIDPADIYLRLRAALDEADAFVQQMPSTHVGLLFLEDNKIVQPDPARLDQYQTHTGQRRGHWPSSADIESAMLEHYKILRDA